MKFRLEFFKRQGIKLGNLAGNQKLVVNMIKLRVYARTVEVTPFAFMGL